MFLPTMFFYRSSFSRKMLYRFFFSYLIFNTIGYFRQPYVMRRILSTA